MTNDKNTRAFLVASSDLIQSAILDACKAQPDAERTLVGAIRAGALLSLRSTFAPATGLAQINVDIIEANGTTHLLVSAELSNEQPGGKRS